MTPLAEVGFLTTVALLFVHELEPVRNAEWRFFFARTPLRDETANRVFTALHVPPLVLVLWGLPSTVFRVAFDGFVVVHAVLHVALRDRPSLAFVGWFSWTWICGSAALGVSHLLLVVWG